MKSFLFSALFSFLSLSIFSQAYDLEWSSAITFPYGLQTPLLLSAQSESYQFLMETKGNKMIFTYGFNGQFIHGQNADFKFNGKEIKLNKLIFTQTKTFAIFHTPKTKEPIWKLYYSELKEYEFQKPQLAYNKTLASTAYIRRYFKLLFPDLLRKNLIQSPDSSKVLLINRPMNSKIKEQDDIQFDLVVFDSNMDVLWDKNQKLNYPNNPISIKESLIDNNGIVFILASINKKEEKDYNIVDRYDYKIFKITENDIESFDFKLENNELKPFKSMLLLPQNEEDICSVLGLYKEKNEPTHIKGLFSFRVNKQSGKGVSRLFPIENIIPDSLKEKYFLKNGKGLVSNFECDNFFSLENGNYGLGLEYRTGVSETSIGTSSNYSYSFYVSKLLLVPYFNMNGELINTVIIDKYFSSPEEKYTSYSLSSANNDIYLLYNDHFKTSVDIPKSGALIFKRVNFAKMIVLNDKSDQIVQKTLFSGKEKGVIFIPKETIISNNHLIIMAKKAKEAKSYVFGIMNLK